MRAQRESGNGPTVRGGSRPADIKNEDEALQGERIGKNAGDNAPPGTM